MSPKHVYGTAAAIGAVAGLRALTAPAITSYAACSGTLRLRRTSFCFLSSGKATGVLAALAVAELIADKLPNVPARTSSTGLLPRLASGAVCGAAVCLARHEGGVAGAVIGAASAAAAAFAGVAYRRATTEQRGVPPSVAALAEDAVAIASGMIAINSLNK